MLNLSVLCCAHGYLQERNRNQLIFQKLSSDDTSLITYAKLEIISDYLINNKYRYVST